jgi:putative tryptophan/tyrosine transport system substrate-binding protein
MMKRRDFITLFGGAAPMWPLVARAQQPERKRRVGVLMNVASDDSEGQTRLAAFQQELQQLGWSIGKNLLMDYRWAADDRQRYRQYAGELVALGPDVVLAVTGTAVGALLQSSNTVPIVFVSVVDPVGAGFVVSLAHPGGNATGFALFEYGLSGKWLELLKEIAPSVTHAAVLRDPTAAAGTGQLGAIQAVAPSLGMELSTVTLGDADEIDRSVAAFARGPNGGLVVTASRFGANHPGVVAALAARYKLPAVYAFPYYARAGGLVSYGPDALNQFRPAARYVDRILKGEKPANLPVQAPTTYELVVNLKTAKTLGLTIPGTVLSRADEVIE